MENEHKLKRNIKLFYISSFFNKFIIWIPFLVLFATEEVGLSYTQYMATEIIFNICVLFLEVPTGVVSDLISRKLSWILGNAFLFFGAFLMIFFNSFWILLISQILWAFYKSFHSGSNQALVYDSLKIMGEEKKYTKILSNKNAIVSLSILISSLLAGFLVTFMNIRELFFIYPVFVFFSFISSLFLQEPVRKTEEQERKFFLQVKNSLLLLKNKTELIPLVFFMALVPAFTKSIFWLATPLLIRLNIPEAYWGNVHALNRAVGIIILMQVPIVISRFGSKKSLLVSLLIMCLGSLMLYLQIPVWAIMGFVMIINTRFVVSIFADNELNQYLPSGKRATILSLVSVISNFVFPIGALISTYIFDNSTYELSLTSIILIFILPIIIFARYVIKITQNEKF
ncbi:MFS transporter [Candidatus Dojkabacteria bacterium]|nr:MFS transporter [Candidatus Dojkabacteria bacterium]